MIELPMAPKYQGMVVIHAAMIRKKCRVAGYRPAD